MESNARQQPDWGALIAMLVRDGRRAGLSSQDAEDLAQDALVRLAREPEVIPGVAPERRARRAHELARIDRFRREQRRGEVPPEAVASAAMLESVKAPPEASTLSVRETIEAVEQLVDPEAARMVVAKAIGYSEREIDDAAQLGASTTQAIRKRIARALPALARRLRAYD